MCERILILTLSCGSGHLKAAEAVAAELSRQRPLADVSLVDVLDECRPVFRLFYFQTYFLLIRFAPALWGRFFRSRVERGVSQTAPVWAWRWGCASVLERIRDLDPGMIICCEVGASELAVIAHRDGLTNARVVNVITDLEAEPIWVKPEVSAYFVADRSTRSQLESWGAAAGDIEVSGIPIDASFIRRDDSAQTRRRNGLDDRQIVLLMGGGIGPTRMNKVVEHLLESARPLQIVALPGRDRGMGRKLQALRSNETVALHILEWTGDVASLMRAADILITKPGGLTLAEAAASGIPLVLLDPIPGPECSNARHFADAGAALIASASRDAANAALSILEDDRRRKAMRCASESLALPDASSQIVRGAIRILQEPQRSAHQLILTISNGFGHIRLARSLAAALRDQCSEARIVDVADLMHPVTRFTHVTAYLWLVKNLPRVWGWIDSFQKERTSTSPGWFYRFGCRRLFELVRRTRPSAMVATEVGCCEIAALIKRDLSLNITLAAVNGELESDRAWVQPEVDLYACVNARCAAKLIKQGAPADRVEIIGAIVGAGFQSSLTSSRERASLLQGLNFDPDKPLILVAGGSEGIGPLDQIISMLMTIKDSDVDHQVVVLAGRDAGLKARCEQQAKNVQDRGRLRVLGWVHPEELPALFRAADLLISKMGTMFYEAVAAGLPIVALEPPPGAERAQYDLLGDWGVGRAVKTIDEMRGVIIDLLTHPEQTEEMRFNTRGRVKADGAAAVARSLLAAQPGSTARRSLTIERESMSYQLVK